MHFGSNVHFCYYYYFFFICFVEDTQIGGGVISPNDSWVQHRCCTPPPQGVGQMQKTNFTSFGMWQLVGLKPLGQVWNNLMELLLLVSHMYIWQKISFYFTAAILTRKPLLSENMLLHRDGLISTSMSMPSPRCVWFVYTSCHTHKLLICCFKYPQKKINSI